MLYSAAAKWRSEQPTLCLIFWELRVGRWCKMANYERWGKRKAVKTRIASYFSGSKEEPCFKFLWCTCDDWAQCTKELILDFALLGRWDSSSLIAASCRRSFIAKVFFRGEDSSLALDLLPACWLTTKASGVGAQVVDEICITNYSTGVGHQAIIRDVFWVGGSVYICKGGVAETA